MSSSIQQTQNLSREEFFTEVAVILDTTNDYKEPLPYRRRWGQRKPGNGRYPGTGVIRWFDRNMIHIAFDGLQGTYGSPDEALDAVREFARQHGMCRED